VTIPTIVKKYRSEKSLRIFAGEISENLPEPISYQSIKNWEDGATRPAYHLMIAIALHYQDWRRDMALEILGVINPEWAREFDPSALSLNINLKRR
jgi:hypothetical protein